MEAQEGGAAFALLDDCDATAANRTSRLYTGFVREHAGRAAELDALCDALRAGQRDGLHAVVLGDYEFGRDLQLARHAGKTQHGGDALLRFLLFSRCERLSRDEADAWLAARDTGTPEPAAAGVAGLRAGVTREQFERAIAAVHDALCAGDSYQINYTYRLAFDVFGTPLALYRRLRARQPVRYGALVALPGDRWVLSCSPELFVEKHGDTLRARPMKGTAARVADPQRDREIARALSNDPKNRAENVMIVDLLRNDLSRIAQSGSVKVPALFTVEPYASVWQMTSTVVATLRARTSFADVVRALFPCGSITGAPKHRTMQLIDALEHGPRGIYTGAIGWVDAPDSSDSSDSSGASGPCGDFCLSVAIRTLDVGPRRADGLRAGRLGIGAGIVLDSVAADEYDECRLKGRFVTEADPGFELIETLYATRDDGVRYLDRHLARLAASAAWLDFAYDEAALRVQLAEQCRALPEHGACRLRLVLPKRGGPQLTAAPLAALAHPDVGVVLAPDCGFAPTRADDPLLRHKTTRRAEFDRAWREAETHGGFDMLFFNERGELTEGGRSNVFVKLGGRWWTPPLASGLLPGVMRGVLLDDLAFDAAERVLTRDDVLNAEALLLCNALRGALPARLVGPSAVPATVPAKAPRI